MMINCPNCNLLQPKDQYCAGCGINMQTWKPPTDPVWKKIASNWMVQLGALFLIIFAVVLKDNFTDQSSRSRESDLPPVSNTIARDDSASFASQNQRKKVPESAPVKKVVGAQAGSTTKKLKAYSEEQSAQVLKKKVTAKVVIMSRSAIERLSQTAQKSVGEAWVIPRKEMRSFLSKNRTEMTSLGSSSKNFSLGQPLEVFIGEEDVEQDTTYGFYTQINVKEDSSFEAINVDLSFSHKLKIEGERSQAFTYDVSLKAQNFVVIVDATVHDLQFTKEETSLFDASSRLQELNGELFADGEVTLILELK